MKIIEAEIGKADTSEIEIDSSVGEWVVNEGRESGLDTKTTPTLRRAGDCDGSLTKETTSMLEKAGDATPMLKVASDYVRSLKKESMSPLMNPGKATLVLVIASLLLCATKED
ncbi:unnamed protein product [Linum trigynum]|uniref:Uncharacterized protein n=1 Tax=Linum trigynum TaxID=586398 RepID=A0AAV2EBA4_9ROSI